MLKFTIYDDRLKYKSYRVQIIGYYLMIPMQICAISIIHVHLIYCDNLYKRF